MKSFIAMVLILCSAVCLFVAGERISAWERTNGYPFGRLCDVFGNCAR